MRKIYLINTGEIEKGKTKVDYNQDDRVSLSPYLKEMIEKEKRTLDSNITPGQMYNIRTIQKKDDTLFLKAGFTDYIEHVAHARIGLEKSNLINPEFNAFCAESVNRTSDGLLIALRREKNLPHGPGIYTAAGGYGVHFRGRKDNFGKFTPLNRGDPYDIASFYVGRELEIPEDSFKLSWLGLAKCYELSFDLSVNFTTNLSQSSDKIMRVRRKDKILEGRIIDDMINFIEDSPDSILNFLSLINKDKRELPKDSLGIKYGENPLTGKFGINDDFIATIVQHIERNHNKLYSSAVEILNEKGYEVINLSLAEGKKLDLQKEVTP